MMLKGNTAAGKSQWSNTEERPLNRKTLEMGTGGERVEVLINLNEMDLVHMLQRTVYMLFADMCSVHSHIRCKTLPK